ncbi:sulfatase family protein [Pontiella sulfatireligans]|uniref:Arylsulfatase n=1 Tax=Pontiella sulfatireligans TaxID=2750658 RepID=A0A6C2UHY9_9BACT|nr:sulfatase [Pontiella sulfatireligans]SPS74340.1 sulfatase S1_N.C [Kiritimatiellales bacterium]VGO19483.1 Arylsulfatase [Pontiella sulfatireligans]
MKHRKGIMMCWVLACLLLGGRAGWAEQKKPNILFILTDDHRWDAMGFTGVYPFLKTPNMDRLAREGAHFENAFVTLSMCSPARASFLTGMYPHKHGVYNNEDLRECDWRKTPSFAAYLQKAGYETGYIGKWHMAHSTDPRPGWDFWAMFSGQGKYNGNDIVVNGEKVYEPGYVSDVLNRYAREFIERDRGDKPYMLYLSHKAVHAPFLPAERHENLYAKARIPKPASYGEDMSNKPVWQTVHWRGATMLNGKLWKFDDYDFSKPWNPEGHSAPMHKNYLRALSAVDEGIGGILDLLEKRGELDNTVVIYAGDNGFMLGEHTRADKRVAYNESIRVPFLLRYPKLVKPGSTIDEMILNIDLAPTLLELAGISKPVAMQGESILPLFKGETDGWRDDFLYTYYQDLQPHLPRITAVCSKDYLLSVYPDRPEDKNELYDLKRDPYEMNNLIDHPEMAPVQKSLFRRLDELKNEFAYRADVPDPHPGRWDGGKIGKLYSLSKPRQFKADTKFDSQKNKDLDMRWGTYEIDLTFNATADGVIASQKSTYLGYVICIEGGRLQLVMAQAYGKYILESSKPVLNRTVNARITYCNATRVFTLEVDGRKEAEDKRINTIPHWGSDLQKVRFGRIDSVWPNTHSTPDSFQGTLERFEVSRSK